jgi:hypothetical protein
MTDKAKVMLSELEGMLISNTEWILTKHSIVEKVSVLLSSQVENINGQFIKPLSADFPELAFCLPKISKGEKYHSLPYVILDYPGIFSRTEVFALRTMFWWGNFFSVTLHLSGKYKTGLDKIVLKNIGHSNEGLYINCGDDEWQHHFEETNYSRVAGMGEGELSKKIVQSSFIKIALKYDLSDWNNMDNLLKEAYSKLAFMIKD